MMLVLVLLTTTDIEQVFQLKGTNISRVNVSVVRFILRRGTHGNISAS